MIAIIAHAVIPSDHEDVIIHFLYYALYELRDLLFFSLELRVSD